MKLRHVPVQDAHGWGGGFYGGEPNAVNMMKRREAPMMLSLGWNADSSQSRSSFGNQSFLFLFSLSLFSNYYVSIQQLQPPRE